MKLRLTDILTALTALLAVTACSDEPTQDTYVYTDVVILEAADDSGATFGLNDRTLYAAGLRFAPEQPAVGDCLLIRYRIDCEETDPQTIAPVGLGGVNNLKTIAAPIADTPAWASQPVALTSAWLNRNRLIIRCGLPYDTAPRTLQLIADDNGGSASPLQLYLNHNRQTPAPSFDREYYLAFNLADLQTDLPRDIVLNVSDTNTGGMLALQLTLPAKSPV